MQVHKDMVCKQCGSVNEHEQVTRAEDRTSGNVTLMIIRCKKCGHEYIQSELTSWSDKNSGTAVFNVTDWTIQQIELY